MFDYFCEGRQYIGHKTMFYSSQEQLLEPVFSPIKYLASYAPQAYKKARTPLFTSQRSMKLSDLHKNGNGAIIFIVKIRLSLYFKDEATGGAEV
jgi:hypothetical protein